MNKYPLFHQFLSQKTSCIPHSRIHKLLSFPPKCFVKRDDELSFGVSGSKLRKYTSLLPFLKEDGIKTALLIGSAYSNHILSFSQLLIENQISPVLFLSKEQNTLAKQGNFLLTSLFIPERQINWVERNDWPNITQIAQKFIKKNHLKNGLIIPEGADLPEALPGALTLPFDICQNEKKLRSEFSHVFIEAGTGLTAAALILAFTWLEKTSHVHVILLADREKDFMTRLDKYRESFNSLLSAHLTADQLSPYFTLHFPPLGASFGATNSTLFHEIIHIARQEGFLTDPIYSAKLFLSAREIIKETPLTGQILLIHSGGALTLMGFQRQLEKALSTPPTS